MFFMATSAATSAFGPRGKETAALVMMAIARLPNASAAMATPMNHRPDTIGCDGDSAPRVSNMAKTIRAPGHVAIIDLLSPTDPDLAKSYNHYERLRDPSHTRALTFIELQSAVAEAGLEVMHTDSIEVEVNVEHWLRLTKTPEPVASQIVSDLVNDISGGTPTCMVPFRNADGELMFHQEWGLVVGLKT